MDFGEGWKKIKESWKNAIIPAILNYIPIVNFISIGYILEAIKRANEEALPKAENYGSLFTRGLGSAVAQLVYGIIFAIIGAIFALIAKKSIAVLVLLEFLVILAAVLVMPAVQVSYAFGGFSEALNFNRVFKIATNLGFIGSWFLPGLVAGVIVGIIFGILYTVASSITILEPLVFYYVALYVAHYMGRKYMEINK